MFPQRGHSTSLECVSTSFMGLFHNTSFDLDLACFCFIHGVRFSQNWFHSWGWFSQRSFNVVFASFRLVHGVNSTTRCSTSEKHCDTVETSVETSALWAAQRGGFRWQPAWQPHAWQPPELVTIGGNRTGNHRTGSRQPRVRGCEPKVRTSLRTCCRYALGNAYRRCVPVCVPMPNNSVSGTVSRTPGCVKCVREVLRETARFAVTPSVTACLIGRFPGLLVGLSVAESCGLGGDVSGLALW